MRVIGGQGVFVKELEHALADHRIDCAVHSLKDVPGTLPPEFVLAAIVEREDARDVLIAPEATSFDDLPEGATLGTSSRRRAALALYRRPDLNIVDLRGNVDTRMSKVLEGSPEGYDAAILAAAGVIRMGWADQVREYLPIEQFVPSPGQGLLAVECRAGDSQTLALVESINDPQLAALAQAERAFLAGVGGGCRSPIGAHARPDAAGNIRLDVMFAREDLTDARFESVTADIETVVSAARDLAAQMLEWSQR